MKVKNITIKSSSLISKLCFSIFFALCLLQKLEARIFDEFQYRNSYWKPGWHGFLTITNFEGKGSPPVTLFSEKYPSSTHLIRFGIPFDLPEEPDEILYTETEAKESISISISPKTTEIFLLLSADFTDKIPLFDPDEKFMRRTLLDDPSQVFIEVIYSDGSSDCFIPANVRKPSYGIENGLGLYVIHPDQKRKPINLVLHDRMKTAAFGIWAITLNTRKPIIEKSGPSFRWYQPAAKMGSPSPMSLRFNLENGIAWDNLESKIWSGKISFSNSPVFSIGVKLKDSKIIKNFNSTDFSIIDVKQEDNICQVFCALQKEEISISGCFSFVKNVPDEILLDLKLINSGKNPVELNIIFPTMEGISFRDWDDTWYFSPAFGGIINNINYTVKSEFGEEHPMQFDGFFSVKNGGGFILMTRDTNFIPRIYKIGKTNNGCFYSIEYVNHVLNPSDFWESVPVIISPVPGYWKEQFMKYREWIKNIIQKEKTVPHWLEKAFAIISCATEENKNLIDTLNNAFDKFYLCDIVQICLGNDRSLELVNSPIIFEKPTLGNTDEGNFKKLFEVLTRQNEQGKSTIMPTNYFRKLAILEQELITVTNVATRLKKSRIPLAVKTTEDLKCPIKYDASVIAKSKNHLVFEYMLFLKECYSIIRQTIAPDVFCADVSGYQDIYPEKNFLLKQIRCGDYLNVIKSGAGENKEFLATTLPADIYTGYFNGCFECILPNYNSKYGKEFQSFMNYYRVKESVAPHYVNLFRFAFPEFKIFSIVAPFSKEYWNTAKYAFFNGIAICLDESAVELTDAEDVALFQKIYRIYHQFSDAFLSQDVEPLVPTLVPGLFANRFSASKYSIWTIYNSNYQQASGKIISVKHVHGSKYFDLFHDNEIPYKLTGDQAELSFTIKPREVTGILQIKK